MTLSFAGTGKIVQEVLDMLRRFMPEVRVISIYAHSDAFRAASLAERFSIDNVYSDYERMLEDDCSDFVYVAVVNDAHASFARRALASGRNVIVEKPMCASASEALELMQMAEERGLFLFDAVTFRYMPNFLSLSSDVARLGRIRIVECNYSQYSSRYDAYLEGKVAPAFDPARLGGALRDLNLYNIAFVASLFGRPSHVAYHANRGFNGIDTSGTALLEYDGFCAVCTAAKDSDGPSQVSVQGELGSILVEGPVNSCSSYVLSLRGEEPVRVDLNGPCPSRLFHEFSSFRRILESGDYEKMASFWPATVDTLAIIDSLSHCK